MVGPPGSSVSTLPITVPVDALLFANFSIAGGRVTTFDAGSMVGEPIEISRAFNDLAAYQVATIAGPLSISAWITNNGSIQAVALRAQAPDAGFDAGIDAGQAIDAGFDAGVDAGSDAGTPDSGFIDSGMPDAGSFDAGDDAGSLPDSGLDAGLQSDAGVDAGADLDAGHDAGAATDAGPDAGATQNDAGQVTVDAGASDAGADTLGPITVGCDCQSVPWFDVMALAGLALLLRRTARR